MRKLWVQSGSGLLTTYGVAGPELREPEDRQGTTVRLRVPACAERRDPGCEAALQQEPETLCRVAGFAIAYR